MKYTILRHAPVTTRDSATKTNTEPPIHTPSHTTSSTTTHFKHTVMTLTLTLHPTLDTQSHAALGPRSPAASRLPAASQPRSRRNIYIGLRPLFRPRGSRTGSAYSESCARSPLSQRLRPPFQDPSGHHGPRPFTCGTRRQAMAPPAGPAPEQGPAAKQNHAARARSQPHVQGRPTSTGLRPRPSARNDVRQPARAIRASLGASPPGLPSANPRSTHSRVWG